MTETTIRCLVHGCSNTSDHGKFVGDLCSPCHNYLTSGVVGPTDSFLQHTRSILHITTLKQIRLHTIGHEAHSKFVHLRFMCDEVEEFEIEDPLKAARWLGYAIRLCEEITGLDNEVTRAWVRQDLRNHHGT